MTHADRNLNGTGHPSARTTRLPDWLAAFGLGLVAGGRSALPLALASRHLARSARAHHGLARLLARPGVRAALTVAAGGELLVDKLPFTPPRTAPLPLGGRVLSGATVGAAISRTSQAAGALAGAAGAALGSFAGYHLRRLATRRLHAPDLAAAVAEDALWFGAARALLARTH